MAKQSPHVRWKGCCLMCAIHRDEGQAKRQPLAVKRLAGRDRRLKRHEIHEDGW